MKAITFSKKLFLVVLFIMLHKEALPFNQSVGETHSLT